MGRLSKRSKAMKLAWEKRRSAAKEVRELVRDTVKKPISLSRQGYSLEQVKELGFAAVTNDGENYWLVKIDGKPVTPAQLT